MKIPRDCKIEKVASTDGTRSHITHALLTKDKKALVATDGHILVAIPVEETENDVPGFVSTAAIAQARKIAPKGMPVTVDVKESEELIYPGPITMPRPQGGVEGFPDWMHVCPHKGQMDRGTITVSFNPKLLQKIADGIGSPDRVLLTFNLANIDGPIDVRGPLNEQKGRRGVLMPMTIFADLLEDVRNRATAMAKSDEANAGQAPNEAVTE